MPNGHLCFSFHVGITAKKNTNVKFSAHHAEEATIPANQKVELKYLQIPKKRQKTISPDNVASRPGRMIGRRFSTLRPGLEATDNDEVGATADSPLADMKW